MDKAFQIARKRLRMATFERECRCTQMLGRRIKAYKVSGTREAGRYSMLMQAANDEAARIRRGEPGIYVN